MPTTAAPWLEPYPVLGDTPDIPRDIKALADRLQLTLGQAWPCTSGTHPAHAAGRVIWETDTGAYYISNGTAWLGVGVGATFSGDSGWLTPTLNDGGTAGWWTATAGYTVQYRKVGNRVTVRGMPTWSAGVLASVITTLPAGYRPSTNTWLSLSIGSGTTCIVQVLVASATGAIQVPSTSYYTGTPSTGMALHLSGSFLTD